MNCTDFLDSILDGTLTPEMQVHIQSCSACNQSYEESLLALSAIKPKTMPSVPFLLKQQILNELSKNEPIMKKNNENVVRMSTNWKRIIAIAASVAFFIMLLPFISKKNSGEANTAAVLFEKAIDATGIIKSMVMKLVVRTDAKENFYSIDLNGSMVQHTITKEFGMPGKWRIEKEGRVSVFDGANKFLWVPATNYALKGGRYAGFDEGFEELLSPETILSKERNMLEQKGVKFILTEKNGLVYLTVNSKAEGNFMNDYMKNNSIAESDNRREYVFDKTTNLLKGLKVYILNAGKEILVLDIQNIDYNVPIDSSVFVLKLPAGVQWSSIKLPEVSNGLSSKTPEEIAEIALTDMSKNDFKTHEEIWAQFTGIQLRLSNNTYEGLEIIKLGKAFTSGTYHGVFVPYSIKLKDGHIKNFNLTIRNDNPSKIWLVDGGF